MAPLLLWALPVAAADVNASLRVDPDQLAGTDGVGKVRLYAPNPVEPGSSLSHWDRSALPNLLMEPSINGDLVPLALDLTVPMFRDIGWTTNGTSTVNIIYLDGADEGFNDPTLGTVRRSAMEAAANVWAGLLRSSQVINVQATFDPLECGDSGAVLGSAGPAFMFRNFDGVPFANTWYAGPLAEALSNSNLSTMRVPDPQAPDIRTRFNSDVDTGCLGQSRFHYGTGVAPPNTISFVAVALHEIAHGLGFLNFVTESTGTLAMGIPDVYSRFTLDNDTGLHWHQMSNQQRATSAIGGNLVWDGPRVTAQAANILGPSPTLTLNSPPSLAGNYQVGTAQFGPPLTTTGVSGDLALARPPLACRSLNNPGAVQGKIAVVDRGTCLFVEKVKNAQNAGALGVVVVNNVAGPPPGMAGTDPTITIPAVSITLSDGNKIKAELNNETEPPEPPEPPETEEPSDCVPDAVTLCLNQGRFKATLDWTTSDAMSGEGQAVPLTDDTGYFWFFDPDNLEVVVKVLDACGFAGRFWVFAGGLTNVEAELRMVDTDTGQVKRYPNPQGTPFQPIQDTDTFATCP